MNNPAAFKNLILVLQKINKQLRVFHLTRLNYERAEAQRALSDIIDEKLSPIVTNASKLLQSSVSGIPRDLPKVDDLRKLDELHED